LSLLATAALGPMPALAAELRWKFQPGETLHYVMDQKTVTSVKTTDADIKTTASQIMEMDWSVKGVAAGGLAEMGQTVARARTKMESPFGNVEYDTQDPKVPTGPVAQGLAPLMKALVGAEFTFKISPQGELSDVKVPRKMVDALREAGAPQEGGSAGMFSEDSLKQMIMQSSLSLPKGNIEKGTSWTRTSKLPYPPIGTMVYKKIYTYVGPETQDGKTLERIDLRTTAEFQPDPLTKSDFKIKSQEGGGSFYFDVATGRITSSRVTQKIETILPIQEKDGRSELLQTQDVTTSMTLGPKGAPEPSK
jgi:hypothetical protein